MSLSAQATTAVLVLLLPTALLVLRGAEPVKGLGHTVLESIETNG